MKILSIQPSAKRQGPAIQHLDFIKQSSESGDVEHLVVLQRGHPMSEDFAKVVSEVLLIDGSREGIVPRTLSPIKIGLYFIHTYKLAKQISELANEHKVDLIWTVNEVFLAGPIAAKMSKRPSLTHVFGMTAFGTKVVGNLLAIFHRFFSTKISPCQDVLANKIAKLGFPKNRISIIYNAIDTIKIDNIVNGLLAEKNMPSGNDESTVNVGMVAGLDRRKGHLLFLEAASIAIKKNKNMHFFLIGNTKGDNAYFKEILLKVDVLGIDEFVTITGSVDSVFEYLVKLDIYCLPSLIEALSVASLEAMFVGLPVIATDVGGNHIGVDDTVTGVLVRPEDELHMATAMLKLASSSKMREQFGNAGRLRAETLFSLKSSRKELNKLFKSLI